MLAYCSIRLRLGLVASSAVLLWLAGAAAPTLGQMPLFTASSGEQNQQQPPSEGDGTAAEKPIMLQLRIAWGGGEPRRWIGEITATDGRLKTPVPLGIEADEPGSIWSDDRGINIQQRSPRGYDAIDVLVAGNRRTTLTVTLTPDRVDQPGKTVSIDLASLIEQTHRSDLDDQGNQLFLRRSPGDRLRVTFDRPSLVFAPGEAFALSVEPYRIATSHRDSVTMRTRLTTAGGAESLWEDARAIRFDGEDIAPTESLSVAMPTGEGVYDLVISLEQRRQGIGAVNPLNPLQLRNETLLTRTIQTIVVAPAPPTDAEASAPSTVVAEIHPAKPWWEKLTTLPEIPGLRKGPLDNGASSVRNHPQLGALSQIGPRAAPPHTSWAAYPLSVDAPGQPHILEIAYPTNMPQSMGISIVEPNAAGAVQPLGLDSGIFVPESAAENAPDMRTHRIPFWPQTSTPFVLITNRREGSHAVHGRIRLLGPPQFNVRALRFRAASSKLPAAAAPGIRAGRQLLAFYTRPLFPENFSAPEAYDSVTERSLDDWRTFHQGGRRLVEYLRYAGYDGAAVSVLSSGSTIYPSELLEPTPRYDTGAFFASGQDPVRKDALEMMFRLFDREQMSLIPSFQFSTPLPRLEQLLREGAPESVGIELIGADGSSYIERHGSQRGNGRHYNPLNPEVQRAVREVLLEVAERYREHPSFEGLALQLSDDGYLLMPNADWGFDDDTVARFARETGISVPGAGPQRHGQRAEFLLGPQRAAWLAWRAEALHAFHRQLLADLRSAVPRGKLYLLADGLLTSAELREMVQPALPQTSRPDDILLAAGLKPELYADESAICLLRPYLVAPPFSTVAKAFNNTLNQSTEIDRHFITARRPGAMFMHQPQQLRLESFDTKSPFGPATTFTWLAQQLQPADGESRRRFIHAVATLDAHVMFDGGWMLPMGQEHATADVIAAYRNLPAISFSHVPDIPQPLIVRTARLGNEGYLYAVNNSPWQAQLDLEVGGLPAWQELTGRRELPAEQDGQWTITLEPYDLIAVKFVSGLPRISGGKVTFPQHTVRGQLERDIRDLVARAASLGEGEPLNVLENGDFETAGPDKVPLGWSLIGGDGVAVLLQAGDAKQGEQSARLTSPHGVASLISAPFAAPETGRITLSFWMRKNSGETNPPIRIAVGARHRNRDYYRYANVPLTDRWEQYVFQIDDLPLADIDRVQVRFDLMAAGEVAIDQVEVYDLSFSENERKELSKIISLASFKLRDDKLADCRRVLEGYWPQFLMEHAKLPAGGMVQREEPPPRREPGEPTPERTGGRWKNILPGFLR